MVLSLLSLALARSHFRIACFRSSLETRNLTGVPQNGTNIFHPVSSHAPSSSIQDSRSDKSTGETYAPAVIHDAARYNLKQHSDALEPELENNREASPIARPAIPEYEPLQSTARQLEKQGDGRTYGASVTTSMRKAAERKRMRRRRVRKLKA